jgi:branched-subunit amino acid aminotransferase/4-amino-4-deoxychorismate lyase
MSARHAYFAVHINGETARADDLAPLAFTGFAHFTAMQVRDGQVRGLDLHLERLRFASLKLFGRALPDDRVRSYLRAALAAGPPDVSLTATMYLPPGEFAPSGPDRELNVLVRTQAATNGPTGPLSLATYEYERVVPDVKHVGEVAKRYFLRQAVAEGFDDAAFVDRNGRLREASIWNLAFWDGSTVVWPAGDKLIGCTMSIVRRQLDRLGVIQQERELTLADLPTLHAAAIMNSWTPGVPVNRIGSTRFPEAPAFLGLLHQCYQAEPLRSP